jgi:hypothetical protein
MLLTLQAAAALSNAPKPPKPPAGRHLGDGKSPKPKMEEPMKTQYRIIVCSEAALTKPARILERLIITRFFFWHLQYWECVATCDVENVAKNMEWLKRYNVVEIKGNPDGYNPSLSIHEVSVLPYCRYKITIHATSEAQSEAFLHRRVLGFWFVVAYVPSAPNEVTITTAESWQTDFKIPEYCVTFKKHWSWTNNSDFPMPTRT